MGSNKKLLQLIACLNKYERTRFKKFLLSPYFNTNRDLLTLFEILSGPDQGINKNSVWTKIYPDQPFVDNRYRRLTADLVAQLKSFFAHRSLIKKPETAHQFFLQITNERELDRFFSSSVKDMQRVLNKSPYRDADYYYARHQLDKGLYQQGAFKRDRAVPINLQEMGYHLDCYYLTEKLKLYCEILTWQKVSSRQYDLLFMDEIMERVRQAQYMDHPAIAIYYQMALTLTEAEEKTHYFNLKNLLETHAHLFHPEEARNMYACAQNFCIRMINQGKLEFLAEIFELFRVLLEKKIIWHNNNLSLFDYKNIIVTGLRLGKFDWVETFINEYKEYLPEQYRENAYTYNLAKLHFYRKDYQEVITRLQQVEYHDIFYNLDSKSMLLKTYYELGEYNALEALIDSFKVFLRRKPNLSSHHKLNYSNFLKLVNKLIRIIPGDKKSIDQLSIELANTTAIADVEWLREKIKEIE